MNYQNIKNIATLNILQKIDGLGNVNIRKFFSEYTYKNLIKKITSSPIEINIGGKKIVIDTNNINENKIDDEYEKITNQIKSLIKNFNINEKSLNISSFWDNDYPVRLNKYHNTPIIIYTYGDYTILKNQLKFIAIIGSRYSEILNEIQNQADKIAGKDYILITGYAPGADFCGINAFVKNDKPIIAILGGSIFDYDLLKDNKNINKKIVQNGLFISEMGFLNHKRQGRYLFSRDNIIACLSDDLYIMDVENANSGTIDTFNKALKAEKNIYVFSTKDSGSGIDYLLDKYKERITVFNDFDIIKRNNNCIKKTKIKKQLKLM